MAADKTILKTLNKLSDEGFDTEKKINSIDMKAAFEHGLADEIGGILKLQAAIKAHKQLAYLLGGTDEKKEVMTDAADGQETESNSKGGFQRGTEEAGRTDPGWNHS